MNELNLSPISSVGKNVEQKELSGFINDSLVEKTTEQPSPVETRQAENQVQSTRADSPMRDVELKFIPDNQTNKVVVYVVDKTSKSVLRTIPPEEQEKLSAGDLLQITA